MLPNISAHLVVAQAALPSSLGSPLVLFTASVAWAALWLQFVVLPFYGKGESLHKDYWASGRINAVIAAIEAGSLIPILSRMFVRVIGAQTDKRKRPENEIDDLLQSVEFLPDLVEAQRSMSKMDAIGKSYQQLKVCAGRLWKWGFGHTLLTPVLPAIYVFLVPLSANWNWLLIGTAIMWSVTLCFSINGAVRFHSQMGRFTSMIEANEQA
jgi:hypothetical protein